MAALLLMASGCSTTPKDLEAKAAPVSQTFPENYQEIYRRTSSAAKRCMAANMGAYASMAVDSELYPDLGYGEVTVSLIDMGIRNYYLSARIEKANSGARLIIHSGNTLGSEAATGNLLRWASGDEGC